jgi:hypothetical protein
VMQLGGLFAYAGDVDPGRQCCVACVSTVAHCMCHVPYANVVYIVHFISSCTDYVQIVS